MYRSDFPMGVWVMLGERHFILLNAELRGWLLRYVMFHEVGHYLFHVLTQSNIEIEFCLPHLKRKQHIEAERLPRYCSCRRARSKMFSPSTRITNTTHSKASSR